MKTDLIKNFDGHNVRVVGTPENPLFVAADVCAVLGLQNTAQSIGALDDDEKGICLSDTPGGKQQMVVITESGLYHLIFKSRKEAAIRFRRWVTQEVLPEIRKHGSYLVTAQTESLSARADVVSVKILHLVDQFIRRGVPAQSASGLASNVFRDSVRQPVPALPTQSLGTTDEP